MTHKITAKTQLMQNQIAGRALPSQAQLGLALDAAREPMLFSLDNTGLFQVSLRSHINSSGWVQVDLGAQLPKSGGKAPVVEHISISQGDGGDIWVALSARPEGATASSVYVSHGLEASIDVTDWNGFGAGLVERPMPQPMSVNGLSLGDDLGGKPMPLLLVRGTRSDGEMYHVQVNPDPNDVKWDSEDIVMPQNASECVDAQPGYLKAHGLGVYALCNIGSRQALTFSPLPQYFGTHRIMPPAVDLALPAGPALSALAPVANGGQETELFVGGGGLYRYDVAAQATSNQGPQTIDDGSYFSDVTSLDAQIDAGNGQVAVWGLAKTDALLFVRGLHCAGGAIDWQTPLPVDTGLSAFAGIAAAPEAAAPFSFISACGYLDGRLAISVQDPDTKLWRSEAVAEATAKDVVAAETYTTRLRVVSDDGIPVMDEDVVITPSFDCAVRVNGKYRMMGTGRPITARTAKDGTVTVVLQTRALEAPVYTIRTAKAQATENPMDHIRAEIGRYKTVADVKSAARTDGLPVFPKGLDDTDADTVVKAFDKFGTVYDGLPATHAQSPQALLIHNPTHPRRVLFSMRRSDCGTRLDLLDEAQHAPLVAAAGVIDYQVFAGDLFAALGAFGSAFVKFTVEAVGAAYEMVVDFGNRVLRFVFEVGAQVLNAVNWLMDQVLGFDLSDIVAWLGFIFDWGAVLQTKKVVRHMTETVLTDGRKQLGNLKTLVDTEAATMRKIISQAGGLQIDASDKIFHDRIAKVNDPAEENPQASWAGDHMRDGLPEAVRKAVDVGKSVVAAVDKLVATEKKVIMNAVDQVIHEVIDQFDTLTFAEIVAKILAIAGETLLNSVENLALTMIDIAEVVADAVLAILTAHIEIPVITYVYEEIICMGDGSKLSLLDAIALLVAAPTSILYRAATSRPVFSDADATAILGARDIPAIAVAFGAMSHAPAMPQASMRGGGPALEILAAQGRTAGEHGLLVLQWLSLFSRTGSAIAFGLKSLAFNEVPGAKLIAADTKLGCDIVSSTFGTIATFMVIAGSSVSESRKCDIAVTWATWVFRVRDGFYSHQKHKTGQDYEHKDVMAMLEALLGFAFLLIVIKSSVLKADSGPSQAAKAAGAGNAWTAALVGKTIQNVSGAVYRIASPASELAQGPDKFKANVVRFACLALATGASAERVFVETPYDMGDLDY